jgi:hypothetical protein
MMKIERIGEKKVRLQTDGDKCLWSGQKQNATRWLDFHVHVCTDGTILPYLAHYTQWQGETSYIQMISLNEAQLFAEEHYEDIPDIDLTKYGLVDLEKLE